MAPSAKPRRRRFLLAGEVPPPIHGSALLFDVVRRELEARGHDLWLVDLARRTHSPQSRMSAARAFEMLRAVFEFIAGLARGYRPAYIVLAESRFGFLRSMLMIWPAWIAGCPVVADLHGGNFDGFYRQQGLCYRFLIRRTLRRVRLLLIQSARLKGMYAFDPALAGRVVAVPNGPPIPLQGRPKARAPGESGRPLRIAFLSNLIRGKGYLDVLEAVRILRSATSLELDAVFAGSFVSEPDERAAASPAEAEAQFLERVAAGGLEDVVRYAGVVSGEEKWRLLENSDFFVLPTNYFNEAQPVSIIEAMAHGCVVIATNFRAIPDMVVDGVTGTLVDFGKPDQIADAIRQASADPATFLAMSNAAVERYRSDFTLERRLDLIIPLVEEI